MHVESRITYYSVISPTQLFKDSLTPSMTLSCVRGRECQSDSRGVRGGGRRALTDAVVCFRYPRQTPSVVRGHHGRHGPQQRRCPGTEPHLGGQEVVQEGSRGEGALGDWPRSEGVIGDGESHRLCHLLLAASRGRHRQDEGASRHEQLLHLHQDSSGAPLRQLQGEEVDWFLWPLDLIQEAVLELRGRN